MNALIQPNKENDAIKNGLDKAFNSTEEEYTPPQRVNIVLKENGVDRVVNVIGTELSREEARQCLGKPAYNVFNRFYLVRLLRPSRPYRYPAEKIDKRYYSFIWMTE